MRSTRWVLILGGASLVVLSLVLATKAVTRVDARPVNDGTVSQGSDAKQDWSEATGDLGNRRYSELSQINTETVKNLGAAWISDKFDDAANSRVTPVVKDGVMYVTAGAKVYALDAKTGTD